MARSNSNQDRPGGQPARQQHATEAVDHGLPWSNGAAAPHAHGYDQPGPGQLPWPQGQPQGQHLAQGQHLGQTAAHQAYLQPQGAQPVQHYPSQHGMAPGYAAPQYPQTYAPQADAHHGHYFPQAGQAPVALDPALYGYAPNGYPQSAASSYQSYQDPAAQLRGSYAGHAEAPFTAPPAQTGGYNPNVPQLGQDPRTFDLGAYGHQQAGYADPSTSRTAPPPAGAQAAHFGKGAPSQAETEAYDDDDYEDEDEDSEKPRRRFGFLKVLGVLVLAIGVGGGAAYGVKKFGGSLLTAGAKPVTVKADAAPTKARPAALTAADGKGAERLGGDIVPAVVPAGDSQAGADAPGTPRKVQTVAIAPNAAPPLRPTMSIPGVTVEGSAPPAPPAPGLPAAALPTVTQAPPGRAVAPPSAAALPQRAPVAPKVIASVEETVPAAKSPAARIPVAPAAKQPKSTDAYSPAAGVGAATVAAATTPQVATTRSVAANGYIAVLASPSSAIDSRKALDDLQGRYSEIIGSKPTDVREFQNPRDGKTYFRAVVGPPGSREAATAVCEQMKTAGHKDCFTAAY